MAQKLKPPWICEESQQTEFVSYNLSKCMKSSVTQSKQFRQQRF